MEVSNLGIQGSEVGHGGRLTEKCPRCSSMNTKFCYFNNYSLTQPRHYCKTCRRYWTQGGVFRNIPVGGATYRRNRRAALGPFVRYTTRRRGRPARSRVAISVSGGPVGGGGSGGRIMSSSIGTDFPDPFETRVSEFRRSVSCFGPMPILSATAPNLSWLHHEISANNNNVVNFPSCQSENLLTSLDPTDHMFLWGLDGPTGSGSSDGNQSDRPPPLPDFDDIDVINDQWTEEDLPRYTPPPPPPPST